MRTDDAGAHAVAAALWVQQHILRLDVSVHNPFAVDKDEGARDGSEHLAHLRPAERHAPQQKAVHEAQEAEGHVLEHEAVAPPEALHNPIVAAAIVAVATARTSLPEHGEDRVLAAEVDLVLGAVRHFEGARETAKGRAADDGDGAAANVLLSDGDRLVRRGGEEAVRPAALLSRDPYPCQCLLRSASFGK